MAKKIVKKAAKKPAKKKPAFGQVIVRCRDAGVHFGTYVKHNGREVHLKDSRRMWQWKTVEGISLSACAEFGIDHAGSRIANKLPKIILLDAAEIIACSPKAAKSIANAPVAVSQ